MWKWLTSFYRVWIVLFAISAAGQTETRASDEQELKAKTEERRQFQSQELITAKRFTSVSNPGDPPRIVWRDVDEIRRLGADGELRVRLFDADLNETEKPTKPGRWGCPSPKSGTSMESMS